MEATVSPSASAEAAKAAFSTLQPFCSRLLQLPLLTRDHSDLTHVPSSSSSSRSSSTLWSLREAITSVPPAGLRLCLEYVLFPLQLLLDASVLCRVKPRSDTANAEQKIFVGDKIAEGVLLCLEELLLRCAITSKTQMNVLLRKFTATASLSTDEASEEIRHGAVKCLKALVGGLTKCGRASCNCHSNVLPTHIILGDGGLKVELISTTENTLKQRKEETVDGHDECLIEFLQSETMSIAVGHLLSLLLEISETEALRGGIGSAKLRVDAFATVRVLLVKVGTADALAFFLPGIASRLVKSVQSSKKMNSGMSELSYPSGAAGSSLAVAQALRALTELIVLVLADERNINALPKNKKSNHSVIRPPIRYEAGETAVSLLHTIRKRNEMQNINNKQTMHSETSELDFQGIASECRKKDPMPTDNDEESGKLRVERHEAWLEYTIKRIHTLLSLCYPALCRHPSSVVRLAITDGVAMLIITCQVTLEFFMPTLLECLLAMACDERLHVASAAHAYIYFLTKEKSGVSEGVNDDIRKVIYRLIERLPKALFSADESVIVFLCRQLLAAMLFGGPECVADCIFQSPATTTQFLKVIFQCFSFNTTLVGSLKQLNFEDTKSPGYVSGILELTTDKVGKVNYMGLSHISSSSIENEISQNRDVNEILEPKKLPQMPPWFNQTVGCKLYRELAGILRLFGLASMHLSGGTTYIHILVEELLVPFRLAQDVHGESSKGLIGSGQWQRTAATMTAVLNEVFYGASGLWVDSISSIPGFHYSKDAIDLQPWEVWENLVSSLPSKHLMECVGDILHEFMSDAIWKLPFPTDLDISDANERMLQSHKHTLRDTGLLHQVLIEGIGVLALSIGRRFEEEGFLRSVLYLLLEKLGCPDYSLSSAADISLHAISSACGYPSVKDLIIGSTDYIIDSLCRQLWHMDLHPNAPNMLVAVLRYVGAGRELVSLLKEPMRNISLELEIPARQRCPGNVLPMLRALKEIVKAARSEGSYMLEEVLSKSSVTQKPSYQTLCDKEYIRETHDSVPLGNVDEIISALKENERRCESIQDTLILCIKSSSPLMASKDEHKCLLALEIIEIGIAALACMEAVSKQAKEERESIREKLCNHDVSHLDGPNNPKLLPTMNNVWPHLISCLKHTFPSVLVQSLKVIASVVCSCGGEFFTRRFQKDATPMILSLLFDETEIEPKSRSQHKKLLPYQGNNANLHREFALASRLKVHKAIFSCLYEIASNKSSASALASSLEQLAAVTVGFACGVPLLEESATQTLLALSNADPDLIWILVADIAFASGQSMEVTSPGKFFPDVSQILPVLSTSEDALWKQLCKKNVTLSTNNSQAWILLSKFQIFE